MQAAFAALGMIGMCPLVSEKRNTDKVYENNGGFVNKKVIVFTILSNR
jgi:hypothetical protein